MTYMFFPTFVYTARLSGRRRPEPPAAARMPAAGAGRRVRPALVREELPGRLHVVQLGEPHARAVADVRAAQARARPSRCIVREIAGVRSERPRAADDRLLGQHHAAAGRAQPAPASARDDQRHVLRAHAARLGRIEAGRSAAGSLHGRAAAEGERARRPATLGRDCLRKQGRSCCSKAGCDTKCRRIPRRRRASASASTTAGSEP